MKIMASQSVYALNILISEGSYNGLLIPGREATEINSAPWDWLEGSGVRTLPISALINIYE